VNLHFEHGHLLEVEALLGLRLLLHELQEDFGPVLAPVVRDQHLGRRALLQTNGFEGGLADLLLVVAEEFALTLVGSVPTHELLDLGCRARLDTTPGSLEAH